MEKLIILKASGYVDNGAHPKAQMEGHVMGAMLGVQEQRPTINEDDLSENDKMIFNMAVDFREVRSDDNVNDHEEEIKSMLPHLN